MLYFMTNIHKLTCNDHLGRESEMIQKLRRYLFCSQDICTLNITMNNTLLMQIDQTFQNLYVVMNISHQDGKGKIVRKKYYISQSCTWAM